MIRAEARAALWQGREVIAAGILAAFGLWMMALGGYVLLPLGAMILALAFGIGLLAWRRLRFGTGGAAAGLVEVDEGQIRYFGPDFGGFVAIPELAELRLMTHRGQQHWRLKQRDGQVLLVPVAATGAEALFDAFASLPAMDTQRLVAVLNPAGAPQSGLPALSDGLGPVVWTHSSVLLARK